MENTYNFATNERAVQEQLEEKVLGRIPKKYHDRIITTHLSDNHGQSDEHLIPGEGNIDWGLLKSYLGQSSKLKNILFEIGTGQKLNEPLSIFLNKAHREIDKYFHTYNDGL